MKINQNTLEILAHFIGKSQLEATKELAKGKEGKYFVDKLEELAQRISTMPVTYQQSEKGLRATAYLHYFGANYDCFVTEKDMGDSNDEIPGQQIQAFGWASFGDSGEFGYINIQELLENNVELDYHFEPTPLDEIDRIMKR